MISSLFDHDQGENQSQTQVQRYKSNRGFTAYTGKYKGSLISIVSIGMGYPMMDFFVREARAIVNGPMVIIRFGTCGGKSSYSVIFILPSTLCCLLSVRMICGHAVIRIMYNSYQLTNTNSIINIL